LQVELSGAAVLSVKVGVKLDPRHPYALHPLKDADNPSQIPGAVLWYEEKVTNIFLASAFEKNWYIATMEWHVHKLFTSQRGRGETQEALGKRLLCDRYPAEANSNKAIKIERRIHSLFWNAQTWEIRHRIR
jgi:hypothetical protein